MIARLAHQLASARENLVKRLGIEQPGGLAKRTQRCRANPQSSLDGLKSRRLLQSAQARDRGTEEVKQQKADVLVEEQPAVARPIAIGADILEPCQQRHQGVEILQTLEIARRRFGSLSSGHCRLPLPYRQSPVSSEEWRKWHANTLAQNSCRTVLPPFARGGKWRWDHIAGVFGLDSVHPQ
jgi:hypothetical protein